MNKLLVLCPKDPIPFKFVEEGVVVHWICGECSQIHLEREAAYKCCKMLEWPLDYTMTD